MEKNYVNFSYRNQDVILIIVCVCVLSFFSVTRVCSCVSLGLSDIPGEAMVKLYCPKCMDVYTPKSSRHHHTDGAYFGTGFPHMLFMVHPEYRPKRPANQFVPRFVSSRAFFFFLVPPFPLRVTTFNETFNKDI